MLNDGRTFFTPNVIVGLGVALLGVVLTLDRMHVIDAIDVLRFWPVLLTLFGASIVAQALRGGAADRQAPILSPPLIIFLVIGGLIATRVADRNRDGARLDGPGTFTVNAVMAGNHRVVTETTFRGADMTSVMGEARLDLRRAIVAPGEEIVIEVFTLMGSTIVVVPEAWEVDVEAVPLMGGFKDERKRARDDETQDAVPAAADAPAPVEAPASATPRVVLRGFIMMGGLVIRS
jgi:hypothetical protein